MCGIAGYVGAVPADLLPSMLRTLKHRGPDGDGLYVEPGVALGMTRLAIIDLVTGQQPMTNEDGSLRVVFNGEIYNFRALRQTLEARGHRFATRSDTEVIVHAYEEFGDACVGELRGMFAFAIWDRRRRRLLLARDRLGKKPLYYWRRGETLVFASEIKALLSHGAIERRLDWDAFHHYLAWGYTPAARSIFADIAKLPPAHTAALENGRLTTSRYWTLPAADPGAPRREPNEAIELVRHELREAVRLRLESDVPLGVFLSGGIDSSAVVASMRAVTTQRIATVSVGFGGTDPSFDELPYARLIAQRFETDHHEEILEPNVADVLPPLVHHFDEPFADSAALPTFIVAQVTARHVKVALSGIGGDEAFGGYPRYLGVRLSEWYTRVPRALRAALETVALGVVPESDGSRNWRDWIVRFAGSAAEPMPARYLAWTRFFGREALGGLVTPEVRRRFGEDVEAAQVAAFAAGGSGGAVDGAFRIDLDTYLRDDLLVMADRMSMAHSLELRAPFCDHRLIEASLSLAAATKIPGLRLKGLLKAAFADVLPGELLTRRKQGFMIPLARWLREDLRDVMEDLLAPARVRARGLFVPAAVEALKHEHQTRRRTHSDRLWTLMMAELWMRAYLDGRGSWTAG